MSATIEAIKDQLTELKGEDIVITVEAGRKRSNTYKGKLKAAYRSVFIVDLDDCEGSYDTVSYSYADVLTDSIDISFPEHPDALNLLQDEEDAD